MMKTKYIKPVADIRAVITEKFICDSKASNSVSIGSANNRDEKEQSDIQAGGPGITGNKVNPFTEQSSTNTREDQNQFLYY